jgi:hypothetical protein
MQLEVQTLERLKKGGESCFCFVFISFRGVEKGEEPYAAYKGT